MASARFDNGKAGLLKGKVEAGSMSSSLTVGRSMELFEGVESLPEDVLVIKRWGSMGWGFSEPARWSNERIEDGLTALNADDGLLKAVLLLASANGKSEDEFEPDGGLPEGSTGC